ncbi:hypothetical protein FGA82_22105 [Pseudomonas fluorescens]|uniref:hypothetical protein n=1 Tax=Pseudomonas fluorescens TaxID=294 RepID=UPI0011313031|nr:hypothetical protein [Pseudomonas fluorescens]TMU73964.1 hypothetical protein FGA82_22105 [Pseudomonas fluorescens]
MALGITATVTVADRLIADFGGTVVDGGEIAASAGKIAFAVAKPKGMELTYVTTDAPSAIHYNNVTYVFSLSSGSLQYSTWNETSWSASTGVGVGGLILTPLSEPTAFTPAVGPGAVVFNGLLYVFYQGTPSGSKTPGLYYSAFNGTAWCEAARVKTVGISCSPCAVVFNDRLYVLHQGVGYKGQLWYSTFDGHRWAAAKQLPHASMSGSPAAAVYVNKLFVLYQDGGHNGQLLYNTLGENWSSPLNTNSRAGIRAEPCAIVSDGELLVFHQGAGHSLNLHVNTFNASSWSGDAQLAAIQRTDAPPPTSVNNALDGFGQGAFNEERPCSPSTVEFNHQLYDMYHGPSADEVLDQSEDSVQSSGASPGAAPALHLCRSPSVVAVSPTLLYAFFQQDAKLCYATCDTTWDRWTSPYLVAWPSATTQSNTIDLLYTPSAVLFTPAGASAAQIYLFYHAIDDTLCAQLWYVIFDPATASCSPPVQVANACLAYSPAAVVFNNELYVFYQGAAGSKGNSALLYDCLSPAGTWSGSRHVPGVGMSFAPAPVIYNDHFYVFFQGESANQPDGNLYYACLSSDGTWSGASQLRGINLSYSPAVIVYNEQVDVFFQGLASGKPDGTVYCAWLTSSGTTSFLDDPAVFNLPVTPLSLASWDTQVPGMPITYSPAAAVCQEGMNNEKLYVLHQGGNGNGQLWFGVFDGTTWSGDLQVTPQVLPATPRAVDVGNMIHSFYKQTGQLW